MPAAPTQFSIQEILNRSFDPTNNRLNVRPDIELMLRQGESQMEFFQCDIANFVASTLTGSASVLVHEPRRLVCRTGATDPSSSMANWDSGARAGWNQGSDSAVLNWSKRVIVVLKVSRSTSVALSVSRVQFGIGPAAAVGALADKGIGIRVSNLTLEGEVHDGTTGAFPDLGTTMVSDQVYTVVIVSDGAGNVEWFVNGTSKATSTGGPTGNSTSGLESMRVIAGNAGTAASLDMVLHNAWIGVGQ